MTPVWTGNELWHVLARVLVGGRRRAAVALRRAALQAQRQASGGTDAFRGRWTWRLLLRCDLREQRALRPRGFAKPKVAYCANAPVGPWRSSEEAKSPSRDKAPGVNTRAWRLSQRSLNAKSVPRQWAVGVCVARGLNGPVVVHTPSSSCFWRIGGFNCRMQSPPGPRRPATPRWPKNVGFG